MIRVEVNGAACEVPARSSVSELVQSLGLDAERIAVEVNRALVPRKEHVTRLLEEGDRVEFVTLVGGG